MPLSKMLPICEVKDLQPSSKIYGRSGTMQNGILYQLAPLVRPTSVKGSGLLPTPKTTDATGGIARKPNKDGIPHDVAKGNLRIAPEAIAQGHWTLPTPTARDWKDNGSPAEFKRNTPTRTAQLLSLPTPTTFDSGSPLPPRKPNKSGGQKPPLVSVIGKKLNPSFVEWMMGYPDGWSDTESSELSSLEIL